MPNDSQANNKSLHMSIDLADKFKAVADVLNFTDKISDRNIHKSPDPIVINRN